MRSSLAFETLTTCNSPEDRYMKVHALKQILVSIAALASAACTSTTDGLELENRQERAAVASNGRDDAAGAKGDHTCCQCPPESRSSSMDGSGEGKCQMTCGMTHDALSSAEPVEGVSSVPRR